MAIVTDYSGEHSYTDGVEAVSYTAPEGGSVQTGVKAIRRELSYPQLQFVANAGLSDAELSFVVWLDTLTDVSKVEDGGLIEDADEVVYHILNARSIGGVQAVAICARKT